jgi:hypothetical protein
LPQQFFSPPCLRHAQDRFNTPHRSTEAQLAYYWDHRKELDQDIERRLECVNEIHQGMEMSPLVKRLKTKGLV